MVSEVAVKFESGQPAKPAKVPAPFGTMSETEKISSASTVGSTVAFRVGSKVAFVISSTDTYLSARSNPEHHRLTDLSDELLGRICS